jgi:hypothetical protein
MATTYGGRNFGFYEEELSKRQVEVTNSLGRTIEHLELVSLENYFGEVREFDDIENGATGNLNIDENRLVQTRQINGTDTFTAGNPVWFLSGGSSAAGELRAQGGVGRVKVGVITAVGTNSITFKPLPQTGESAGDNVTEFAVTADATGALDITGIPYGARIVGVEVICTASNASGTLQLKTGATTPADITDAITCAVDTTKTYASTIDNEVVGADGVTVTANGAADRGIVRIIWR